MKKEKWNYLAFFLIGFGLGALIIGTVFEYNTKEVISVGYTQEDVLNKANELLIKKLREKEDEDSLKIQKDVEDTKGNELEEIVEKVVENEMQKNKEYIKFVVKKGECSEEIVDKLVKQNIITDKSALLKLIAQKDLAKKIMYGEFEIPKNCDVEEVIEILTH